MCSKLHTVQVPDDSTKCMVQTSSNHGNSFYYIPRTNRIPRRPYYFHLLSHVTPCTTFTEADRFGKRTWVCAQWHFLVWHAGIVWREESHSTRRFFLLATVQTLQDGSKTLNSLYHRSHDATMSYLSIRRRQGLNDGPPQISRTTHIERHWRLVVKRHSLLVSGNVCTRQRMATRQMMSLKRKLSFRINPSRTSARFADHE